MLSSSERTLVKLVAKISPWLAPLPSGYFVARAGQAHLDLPMVMAVVVGLIIELLGIASVHTWLWLIDRNINKRKSDPEAPAVIAAFLGCLYLIATIGLTVMLEVFPGLATYSPAIFPVLAIVGAVNLTLIAQQQQRESVVYQERMERGRKRDYEHTLMEQFSQNQVFQNNVPNVPSKYQKMNSVREQKKLNIMNKILNAKQESPDIGVTELSYKIGCSRNTVYRYLKEIDEMDRSLISKNASLNVVGSSQ